MKPASSMPTAGRCWRTGCWRYERQTYRHIVGTPRVTGPDTAETPFLVVRTMRDGRMDLFVAGRYRDRLRNDGGTLTFRERFVICDSSHFDTLVAIPL